MSYLVRISTRDFAHIEETSVLYCLAQSDSQSSPETNSLAFHFQPLSTVILILLDINFQESVFTTELFNGLLYHHDAFTFRWTTSRS